MGIRPPTPLLVILAAAFCAQARAQTCTGFGSLLGSKYRVDLSAARYTYATAVRASVTTGRSLFATLGVGATRDGELDASTYDLSAQVGYDVPMGEEPITFCPELSVSYSLGPYDFMLNDGHFTYLDAGVGLSLAGIAVRTGRVTVIPAVGAHYSRLALKRVVSAEQRENSVQGWVKTDWYGVLSAGVGVVIDDHLVLRPGVTVPLGFVPVRHESYDDWIVPFGREDGEVSLNLTVGIRIGRRGRQAR